MCWGFMTGLYKLPSDLGYNVAVVISNEFTLTSIHLMVEEFTPQVEGAVYNALPPRDVLHRPSHLPLNTRKFLEISYE